MQAQSSQRLMTGTPNIVRELYGIDHPDIFIPAFLFFVKERALKLGVSEVPCISHGAPASTNPVAQPDFFLKGKGIYVPSVIFL